MTRLVSWSGSPITKGETNPEPLLEYQARGHFRRAPWVTLLIVLLAAGTMMFPAAAPAMQYDRDAIGWGQFWRIGTCHFAHFSFDHIAWCVLAMLVLGAACELIDRRRMLICLIMSMVLIPIALFEFQPDLATYRGLSGIDSAFFVLLLAEILRRRLEERHWIGLTAAAALGVAFVVKILLEMCLGVTFFVENFAREFDPVPLAHLIGLITAIVAISLPRAACSQG